MILSAIEKVEGDLKMCEIGGGTGNMAIFLARRLNDERIQINVIEPLENYVKFASRKAKNYKNVFFINDTVEELNRYKNLNNGVNFYYTVDTLHHVKNPINVLNILKDEGNLKKYFIIIEPNNYNFYSYLYHRLKKGEKVFNHNKFIDHAILNNWKVLEKKYFYTIPFNFRRFTIFRKIDKFFSKSKYFCGSVYIILCCD